MRVRARDLLPALALAMLASCSGAPPPQPEPVDGGSSGGGAPPQPPGSARAGDVELSQLPNGLTVAVLPHRLGDMAQVQLGLLAGSDFAAPGLAELAAEVLVDSADATSGRISVRQAVATQGGTVSIEVNPLSTWITIRLPQFRWARAQAALAEALSAPPTSRSQIERVRDDYALRRIRDVWRDPAREVPRAFLLGNAGTSPYIASLLDRDASEISLFAARLYRPESAVLALTVPGSRRRVAERLEEGMARWPLPTAARAEVPIETRRLETGLYWAPGEPAETCRAIVILPLPSLTNPLAAELFTMHACVTLDGIGGRLEGLQREQGLANVRWRSQVVDLADVPAIALTTETSPADAARLWNLVQAARQSLVDLPPTASELELATRRARLTAKLLASATPKRGRIQALLATLQQTDDALDLRFDDIAQSGLDVGLAARGYLQLPAAMAVLGGAVPAGLSDYRAFELLPPGALARLTSDDPVAQAQAATPWLDRAMEALGGEDLLRRLDGFRSEAKLRSAGAPEATEALHWQRSADAVTRTRQILGTTIETAISADGATEHSGDRKVTVPPHEIAMLRRELARHPVSLLAACARDELRFRPVAQRTVGDRDLMILEAVGGAFDRLRIHVDTTSHLIRVVEVWETNREGSVFRVRDAWSDYRGAGPLRAPYRRLTEHDDGRNRIEAVHTRWEPLLLAR